MYSRSQALSMRWAFCSTTRGVCPPPPTLDGLENVGCDVHVPGSLAEVLDELEADETFVEAFGAEAVAQFCAVKRTEWDQFTAYVTDWELDTYLPYL